MGNISDGRIFLPERTSETKIKQGDFVFSATRFDHGHLYSMCKHLIAAGATLKYVWDPDPAKVAQMLKICPTAIPARCEEEILQDQETQLVAAAAITSERGPLGVKVMTCGKDYFTDKAPFTTLEQLEKAKTTAMTTKQKYMVFYSERLCVEGAILAGYMIDQGAIGKVISTSGFGPHRLRAESRPAWFFEKDKYGGILCDIGSHQIEQYLYYTHEEDATITAAHIGNYATPQYPELDDFGDCMLTGANGTTGYFRVDWFTPDGLRTWGDGRILILGTEGYIEIRKYVDPATDKAGGNHVILVNDKGEQRFEATGITGFPFFRELVIDCLNRTENAMSQAHAFKAAELCIQAQMMAQETTGRLLK